MASTCAARRVLVPGAAAACSSLHTATAMPAAWGRDARGFGTSKGRGGKAAPPDLRKLAWGSAPGHRARDAAHVRAFRESVSRWIHEEIAPHVAEWDEREEPFPREVFKRAAEVGVLGVGYPEKYGGVGEGDLDLLITAWGIVSEAGSGGFHASLGSHGIALPPIVNLGSEEMKERVVPEVISGDKIAALAITEPSGGSDVANLRTTARRDGDHYIVNGQKTFITSGVRADYLTVAVRTGGEGPGGVSLLLIEGDTPGMERTPLKKMGWWCSDTATIFFDDCRVPASNLIGNENEGFKGIMLNFNNERILLAVQAVSTARNCLLEALEWAHERHTFGEPLINRQVIRHKLVDMAMRIEASQAFADVLIDRLKAGESPVAEICMLKNTAVECMEFCAAEAVQILGGAGFMRGGHSERAYREQKVVAIGGGATEIMKDLAARQMGL